MLANIKQAALLGCLFVFLFIVIGGGLHLNAGGAFLAAATGTPLVIHFFNRERLARVVEHDFFPVSRGPGYAPNIAQGEACRTSGSEIGTVLRQ